MPNEINIPNVWKRTVNKPLDAWTSITSKDDLDVKIPVGIRYKGMSVFVETESKSYHFKDGVADADFIIQTFPTDSSVVTFTKVYSTITAGVEMTITHDMMTTSLMLVARKPDGTLIDIVFKFGDATGNNQPNAVTFTPAATENNVRVFIVALSVVAGAAAPVNLANILQELVDKTMTTATTSYKTLQDVSNSASTSEDRLSALENSFGSSMLTAASNGTMMMFIENSPIDKSWANVELVIEFSSTNSVRPAGSTYNLASALILTSHLEIYKDGLLLMNYNNSDYSIAANKSAITFVKEIAKTSVLRFKYYNAVH